MTSTTQPPLHVIFGTGAVGLAVMDELCKHNVRIRLVNRSGRTSEPLPTGVELVAGDAANPAFATQAAEGAAVIYFAVQPPYHLWPQLFPALQASAIDFLAFADRIRRKCIDAYPQ
ncbi:MAG: NAD(P)H-binding protein [Chloroflexota bacterium]